MTQLCETFASGLGMPRTPNHTVRSGYLCVVFLRPTQNGRRVTPENLRGCQETYRFKNPCCLCASNVAGMVYTESEIYMAVDGRFWGEYVACCAADRCGYLGKLQS
jgi:hypothetical protein